ncbi:hypothetical protein H2203_004169 [Taxawa tesnikishii (nom. ined.)]|nr:hypothetical protein H2203_004169 [Dothideales sp. JES 119]
MDCKEAMFENLIVITRMNERIQLLRNEVEKRGMRWADAEVEERDAVSDPTNTNGELANGTAAHGSEAPGVSAGTAHAPESRAPSGRLTDEELVRRLQEQMGEDEEEGVHL